MDFYFGRAGIPHYIYTDKKSAKALGWTIRKTQAVRLKLIKAGYFKQIIASYNNGFKKLETYVGKIPVERQSWFHTSQEANEVA